MQGPAAPDAGELGMPASLFLDVIEAAPDALLAVDRSGVIRLVNRQTEAMFGYARQELVGQELEVLIPQMLRSQHRGHRRAYAKHPTPRPMGTGLALTARRRDGEEFAVDVSLSILQSDAGPLYLAAVRDVTQRKEAEEALRQANDRFRSAFEDGPVGMAVVGLDGVPLQVNAALCQLLGQPQAALLDPHASPLVAGDLAPGSELRTLLLQQGTIRREERQLMRGDGQPAWVLLTMSLLADDLGLPAHYLLQVEDITVAKQVEATLIHRAAHDPLTGLPNRSVLTDRLTQALARSERQSSLVATLFLDLDHFKRVNDGLGHDAGDALLVAVAERLRGVLRGFDTATRFGGDEFVLVCEDLRDEAEAREIATRVAEALAPPFLIAGRQITVGASIGVVLASGMGADPQTILRNADATMYRAKDGGRGRFEIYNQALRLNALELLDLEAALRQGIERGEFEVHYQPQVSILTGKLMGFEALVRWHHPQRGLLAPAEFIPVAEEMGLIVPLGTAVLTEACREAATWPVVDGLPKLSVNLSPRQFSDPRLADLVTGVLADTGLEPTRLCLEITESGLLATTNSNLGSVEALRAMGILVSIDDFGTGYASLTYVADFHPDELKVDQSFVRTLGEGGRSSAIVSAVVGLAHSLGIGAVAEGVEAVQQLECVRTLECDRAQGYLLGSPRDREATRALLRLGVILPGASASAVAVNRPGRGAGRRAPRRPAG